MRFRALAIYFSSHLFDFLIAGPETLFNHF